MWIFPIEMVELFETQEEPSPPLCELCAYLNPQTFYVLWVELYENKMHC